MRQRLRRVRAQGRGYVMRSGGVDEKQERTARYLV
jgi:hypothetical protein